MEPITIGLIAAAAGLLFVLIIGIAFLYRIHSHRIAMNTFDPIPENDPLETKTPINQKAKNPKEKLFKRMAKFIVQKLEESHILVGVKNLIALIGSPTVQEKVSDTGKVLSEINIDNPIQGNFLMIDSGGKKIPADMANLTVKMFFMPNQQLPNTNEEFNNLIKITITPQEDSTEINIAAAPPK